MIQVFKKFFKKLEKISFHDCVIEKNCSFRELNCDLHFEGCEIKSTNSYNYCEQSIEFLDCKIDKITNAVINSNNIRISGKECNDYMLTLLFLKCHFPNLESLIIGSKLERCEIDNSINYNSCLYFMPYSCPKLMDLFIQGSVNSFDFLYHFNKLTSCEIRSVDDSIGPYEIYNPYITDELERKEIVNKSKRNIETSLDINLALYDRLAQILKALSCINFFDEEKNLYLYQKTPLEILNPLRCFREQKVNYYYSYDSINGILKLHFDHAGDYKLVNDNFYYIKRAINTIAIMERTKVITSVPFIYHPTGIPIKFDNDSFLRQDFINQALALEHYFDYEASSNCNNISDNFCDSLDDDSSVREKTVVKNIKLQQ